jgi:hypothetical protein
MEEVDRVLKELDFLIQDYNLQIQSVEKKLSEIDARKPDYPSDWSLIKSALNRSKKNLDKAEE